MTLSALDDTIALIIVDLQAGTVSAPTAHPSDTIVENAAALAAAFRGRQLPVVLATVTAMPSGRTEVTPAGGARAFPAEWTALDERLGRTDSDAFIERDSWDAFDRTGLDELLRTAGVTQVVVAGMATSIGVESTARSAYQLGYNVVLALDAITDRDAGAHDAAVRYIFPLLSQLTTTGEVLDALTSRD